MKKILLALIFLFLCFPSYAQDKKLTVTLFHSSHCHACIFVRSEILPPLKEKYKDKVVWKELEVDGNSRNLTLLTSLTSRLTNRKDGPIVPTILISDKLLRGKDEIAKKLYPLIEEYLANPRDLKSFESRDMVEGFQQISPLMVIKLGALNGINPCAFAAIAFLLSFLVLCSYSRREVICAGLGYCLAVFFTYTALGLGLFKFFYRFIYIYPLISLFYLFISGICFLLACFAAYDYVWYKRTKESRGMLLRLPDILNKKINLGVGSSRPKEEGYSLIRLIAGGFFVGILVSLLEAVCTGQVYFPAIIMILNDNPMRLKAFLYILLYSLMFVMPIFLVFAVSVLGVNSRRFKGFINDNLSSMKLLMVGIFFLLGTVVIVNSDPGALINGGKEIFGKNKKTITGLANKNPMASKAKYMGLDLGDMPSNKIYQGAIKFPFGIKSVSTSCECLKTTAGPVSLSKDNHEWIVQFYFDPKGYYGYVEQEIRVVAEPGQLIVLKLKGNVIEEKATAK